jgi:anti-sigma-K factor RskA
VGSVTTEACRRWREMLGAYLLEHLSPEERVGVEAHLDGCADCRAELEELRPVSRSLSSADPSHLGAPPAPPPELADRVFSLVRTARRTQRRRRWSIALAAAVAAAVVAVSVTLAVRPANRRAEIEKFSFTALPAGVTAEATLYKRKPGVEVWIEVEGLTPGTTYAVWVERPNGERVKCGTFNAVNGNAHVVLPSNVRRIDTAAVGVSTTDGRLVMRAPVSPPQQA